MILAELFLGAEQWLGPAIGIMTLMIGVVVWSYYRCGLATGIRFTAMGLKLIGIAALVFCLVEPMITGKYPRRGANLFVVLADNSQSLAIKDPGEEESRADKVTRSLGRDQPWMTRLEQDFDVRRYSFAGRPESVADFHHLDFVGKSTHLVGSLSDIAARYKGRPLAGVLLFSDGNADDLNRPAVDWESMPAIYPVRIGQEASRDDLGVNSVTVSQTNFEAAPVTVRAEIEARGYTDENVTALLLDRQNKLIGKETVKILGSDEPNVARFQFRPEKRGVTFYQVKVVDPAFAKSAVLGAVYEPTAKNDEEAVEETEATAANNQRMMAVDRTGGPYRILYVCGRPNWEFKFLRRAIEADPETHIVGLIRIAKREPKFDFRSRDDEKTNPLFRGFENQDDEDAEQYYQPVLIRIGIEDEQGDELRDGFPKSAEDLFDYHAVILDDIEASYFSPDQMSLLKRFVSLRGGGLLMLGGQESFVQGDYARTPIGEILPVYTDGAEQSETFQEYEFSLSREGWLEPWTRLRTTELEEEQREREMPSFQSVNHVRRIKPGAQELAYVRNANGDRYPALVSQSFGKGRTAALLIGDMWRWDMRREAQEESDLQKSWRQMIRWLVADVPKRIEIDIANAENSEDQPVTIRATVRDEIYEVLDNASVQFTVTNPDGEAIELTGEPSQDHPGVYVAQFTPTETGPYHVNADVQGPDGSEIGTREAGWSSEPAAKEFRRLEPDFEALENLAKKTGGEMVDPEQLARFVADLPNKRQLITETKVFPLWHKPFLFLIAIACLAGEWGLRRWKGLP